MSNLNLKGLWIPIEILTDKNLSDKEKHIYSLVIFLSQEKQYCFCTNKTISELLNISVTQVSKLVNSLKDKGYINIEMVYKENSKEVDIRKLIPIVEKFKDTTGYQDLTNLTGNNTSSNNTSGNTSNTNATNTNNTARNNSNTLNTGTVTNTNRNNTSTYNNI